MLENLFSELSLDLAASTSFRRTELIRLAGDTSVVRLSGDGDDECVGRDLGGGEWDEEEDDVTPAALISLLIRAKVIATLMLLHTSLFTGRKVFLDFVEGVDEIE